MSPLVEDAEALDLLRQSAKPARYIVGICAGCASSTAKIFTGGGVTAGIKVALQVVAEIAGREEVEPIQRAVEYDPKPAFTVGSPETAPPALVDRVVSRARGGR